MTASTKWQDPAYRATIINGARRFWDGELDPQQAAQRRAERSARAVAGWQNPDRRAIMHGRRTPEGRAALQRVLDGALASLQSLPVAPDAPHQVRLEDLRDDLKVTLRAETRQLLKAVAMVRLGSGSAAYYKLSGRSRGHGAKGFDKPLEIAWLLAFCRDQGLDAKLLESSVVSLAKFSQQNGITTALPIQLGPDHAWMLGLAFAGAHFLGRREGIAINVDEPVADLVETVCARLGATVFRTPLARGRLGPKATMRLPVALAEVLHAAGLPSAIKRDGAFGGHKAGTRREHLSVPAWIRGDPKLLARFTEGYLNGPSTQCTAPNANRKSWVFQMKVQATDAAAGAEFAATLAAVLEQHGIHGTTATEDKPLGRVHMYRFGARASLEGLLTNFNVRRYNVLAMRSALGVGVDEDLVLIGRRERPSLPPRPVAPPVPSVVELAEQARTHLAAVKPARSGAISLWALPGRLRVTLRDDVRDALYRIALVTPAAGTWRVALQHPTKTGRNRRDRRAEPSIDELRNLAQVLDVDVGALEAGVVALHSRRRDQTLACTFPVPLDEDLAWLLGLFHSSGTLYNDYQTYVILPKAHEVQLRQRARGVGATILDHLVLPAGAGRVRLTFPTPVSCLLLNLACGRQPRTVGRRVPERLRLHVPASIEDSPQLLHAFAAGFLAGNRTTTSSRGTFVHLAATTQTALWNVAEAILYDAGRHDVDAAYCSSRPSRRGRFLATLHFPSPRRLAEAYSLSPTRRATASRKGDRL